MKFGLLIITALAVAGCNTQETVLHEDVSYRVDRAADLNDAALPQNSDLQMMGGDLARYAASLCARTVATGITRCELFVQPDQGSLVHGYAALSTRDDGVRVDTQAQGCWIDGDLETYSDGANAWRPLASAAADFRASIMYSAWERSPGDWVSAARSRATQIPDDEPVQGNLGVWNLERFGPRLRIQEERWSYCSKDRAVDDVFTHVLTLTRV